MNVIHALIESWNWYCLKRKSKQSAQLTFQQLSEFHELIRNKSISNYRTTADIGAGEIRVAGSSTQSNLNQ